MFISRIEVAIIVIVVLHVCNAMNVSKVHTCPLYKCLGDCATIQVQSLQTPETSGSECQDDYNCTRIGKNICCDTCCGKNACF